MKKFLTVLFALLASFAHADTIPNAHVVSKVFLCASTTGAASSTAYSCQTTPTFTLQVGDKVMWDPGTNDLPNSTSTPTLAVNGGSAITIRRAAATSPMLLGDVGLVAPTSQFILVYDGTYFELQSNSANTPAPYTNAAGTRLDAFYSALRKADSQIVRIAFFGDSIITCYQIAPCNFGAFLAASSPPIALRFELCKIFNCYSTGFRQPFRLVTSATVDGGEGGYAVTNGSVSVSTLLGPQESGVSLNGGSLLQAAASTTLTFTVGQAWSKMIIYCATNATSTGWTPAVGGVAQSNICTAQPGSATAITATISNPTAITTQIANNAPTAFTLGSLGANSFLGGYEAVITNNNFGLVIDNFGVGGISAPWFAGSTGLVWWNLVQGLPALCVMETGENDANSGSGPQTGAQVTSNLQVIATNCQSRGASNLVWIPPPYTSGATTSSYTAIQTAMFNYGIANGWDVLVMGDVFVGAGITAGMSSFASQNTTTVQNLNCAYGLMTCSDNQHLTDAGSQAAFNQLYAHLFDRIASPVYAYGVPNATYAKAVLTTAYTNATTAATSVTGWTFAASNGQQLVIQCDGMYQAAATGGLRFQVTGPSMTSFMAALSMGLTASTSGGSAVTALSTLTTSTAVGTATTNFPFALRIYAQPSANGTVQIQAASVAAVNLTIGVGSVCFAR